MTETTDTEAGENGSTTHEHDGRSVQIDTGYYEVQVWGDPDDSLEDVHELALEAADRAKEDIEEFDDRLDDATDDGQYV